MVSTIIFLSILVLFLSAMLIIKVRIKIDLNNFFVLIVIHVYSLKIIEIRVDLLTLKYRVNKSKKEKHLKLIIKKEEKYLLLQIKKSVLDKLYYDNLNLRSNIGLNDASLTANVVGAIDLLCYLLRSIFVIKNKEIDFDFINTPEFVTINNLIEFKFKVYFTIFDMVFAIILSFYKRGKYVKQKGKARAN